MRTNPFIPTKKIKPQKAIPHSFVLEYLAPASPYTRPMFGCISVYVDDKIVLILRDKKPKNKDNGVWIATMPEHHESLQKEFPSMRFISIFGKKGSWRILPSDTPDFEESVIRVCEMILENDRRIGKVPALRRKPAAKKKKPTPRR